MATYGYSRVSTLDQHPELQHDALVAAGCERIFTDHASGATSARPQLDKLLATVQQDDGLVVWRLDRLGRSLRHLIDVVTNLEERGIHFKSLHEGINTSTASGRLIFNVFGALAQFERELLVERTKAGLAAARARGRVGGRPRALSPEQSKVAHTMNNQGSPVTTIAGVLGVSRATVYRELAGR